MYWILTKIAVSRLLFTIAYINNEVVHDLNETVKGEGGGKNILVSIEYHCDHMQLYKTCSSPTGPTFFYTRSQLSALQNCALLFSTNFKFIFIYIYCRTQFSHLIVSCTTLLQKYCRGIYYIHAQFCRYWVIDYLLKCKKLFY